MQRIPAFASSLRQVAVVCFVASLPLGARAELALSEIFYDAVSSDDGFEWIELINDGNAPIDLGSFSLGWGGADWFSGTVALSGTIAPGDVFVVGGPTSVPENGSPAFDLAVDLEADLQNSGATADGVALFGVPLEQLTPESIPLDVVLYGEENVSGLVDATGLPSIVHVADAPGGSSIERGADGVWRVQEHPTPGLPAQLVPEPGRLTLAAVSGAALAALAVRGSPRDADRSRR